VIEKAPSVKVFTGPISVFGVYTFLEVKRYAVRLSGQDQANTVESEKDFVVFHFFLSCSSALHRRAFG